MLTHYVNAGKCTLGVVVDSLAGWNAWQLFTATCGVGTQIRTRPCTSPVPFKKENSYRVVSRVTKRCNGDQ